MLGQTDAQCSEMDKKTLKFNEKLLVKCIVHGFKNDQCVVLVIIFDLNGSYET